MHDIVDTLGPAAATRVLGVPLDTTPFEMLTLSDGISVALQQFRSPEDVTSLIEGEDLFKLHVQLSGQRL
jgi:hypothetical protein